MTTPTWHITARNVDERVRAVDHWAAWNTLRNRPAADFGLLVSALREGLDDGERVSVTTQTLFYIWHRDDEAGLVIDMAVSLGLTTRREAYRLAMKQAREHGR